MKYIIIFAFLLLKQYSYSQDAINLLIPNATTYSKMDIQSIKSKINFDKLINSKAVGEMMKSFNYQSPNSKLSYEIFLNPDKYGIATNADTYSAVLFDKGYENQLYQTIFTIADESKLYNLINQKDKITEKGNLKYFINSDKYAFCWNSNYLVVFSKVNIADKINEKSLSGSSVSKKSVKKASPRKKVVKKPVIKEITTLNTYFNIIALEKLFKLNVNNLPNNIINYFTEKNDMVTYNSIDISSLVKAMPGVGQMGSIANTLMNSDPKLNFYNFEKDYLSTKSIRFLSNAMRELYEKYPNVAPDKNLIENMPKQNYLMMKSIDFNPQRTLIMKQQNELVGTFMGNNENVNMIDNFIESMSGNIIISLYQNTNTIKSSLPFELLVVCKIKNEPLFFPMYEKFKHELKKIALKKAEKDASSEPKPDSKMNGIVGQLKNSLPTIGFKNGLFFIATDSSQIENFTNNPSKNIISNDSKNYGVKNIFNYELLMGLIKQQAGNKITPEVKNMFEMLKNATSQRRRYEDGKLISESKFSINNNSTENSLSLFLKLFENLYEQSGDIRNSKDKQKMSL